MEEVEKIRMLQENDPSESNVIEAQNHINEKMGQTTKELPDRIMVASMEVLHATLGQ